MKRLPTNNSRILLIVVSQAACAPRVDLETGLMRLRETHTHGDGHQRTLAELDVSADGVLGAADFDFFTQLAQRATERLNALSVSLDPIEGLYHGPAKDAPGAFARLADMGADPELSRLDIAELRELAIEARWMAMQVRLATLRPGALQDQVFGGVLLAAIPGYNPEAMEPAAVCRAVDAIDLEPFHKAGVPATAIFDLDNTVWAGDVMDPFLAILVDKGSLSEDANPPLRAYLKTLKGVDVEAIDTAPVVDNARLLLERWTNPEIPRDLRPSAKDMFYNIVAMMRGMTIAQAEAAAREVYSHGVGRYPPWHTRSFADKDGCSMRALIARMKERGIEVYLLSATLDVLAREGGRVLGIPPERVLGSLLEVRDGKYTGRVRESTYDAKGAIVRQWLPAPPLVAFGDSPNSDFPMLLEVVGASFMVNPRPEFLERDKNESGSRFVALWFDGTEQELAIQP